MPIEQSELRPVPVYLAPSPNKQDEVSLVSLWRIVARHKAILLLSLLAALLLAGAYLFFVKPVYRATAHLLPPQQQNIQGLLINNNDGADGVVAKNYTPEFVYKIFLENLGSRGVRREFFDRHNLVNHYLAEKKDGNADVDRVFDTGFNKCFQVQTNIEESALVTISFSDADPGLAAQLLNQFVEFANERTIYQLLNDVNAVLNAQINRIREQLTSKQQVAEQRRLDAIINLKEALRVAKALGIKDASTFPRMTSESQTGLAVNTAQVPAYMRGTEALETEIMVLESRKSDEPFIDGFRDLQERLAFLEGLEIDAETLSAVKVDSTARTPYEKASPRGMLVVLVATMFGLGVGTILVFVIESFTASR